MLTAAARFETTGATSAWLILAGLFVGFALLLLYVAWALRRDRERCYRPRKQPRRGIPRASARPRPADAPDLTASASAGHQTPVGVAGRDTAAPAGPQAFAPIGPDSGACHG